MITQEQMSQFARFCEERFDLHTIAKHTFQSLPICIIECIYSLRANYTSTTNVVQRYADKCMGGDISSNADTISNFITQIDNNYGGPQGSAGNLFESQAKFGHGITPKHNASNLTLKSEVCYNLARKFQEHNINNITDFRSANPDDIERYMREVKWVGDAAVNYLFMLAGDPTRVKPDVHIHHCVRDCFGYDLSNQDIQVLFTDTVHELQSCYSTLTVRNLDSVIWNYYHR